ncbi:MAG: hypothetical protein AAB263_05740, partial [Planctomycetota bacterium]
GLNIMSGGNRDHALVRDDTAIRLWLEVDDDDELNAAFLQRGVSLPITVSFVTDATPARKRHRTFVVRVLQQ